MPSIRTGSSTLAKAIGGGLLVALLVAVLWRFLPGWTFYLTLGMGFGVVETMAKLSRNKRGIDLQIAAMVIITIGFVISRLLLAQRYGIDYTSLTELTVRERRLLQLDAVPDLVYMALAYLIAWVRFR